MARHPKRPKAAESGIARILLRRGYSGQGLTRIFTDHNVTEKGGQWIARECDNHMQARAAEKALLEYGCDGGPGGGDENSTWVYAYLKTPQTLD